MPDTTTTQPPAQHAAETTQPPASSSAPPGSTTQAPASSQPGASTTQAPASSSSPGTTTTAPPGNGPSVTGVIEIVPDDGTQQHSTSVQVKESATLTLTWNATNADHVSCDGLGDNLGVSGSQSIPTQDATYSLVAVAADGTRSSPCQLWVSTHSDDEVVSGHAEVYPPGGPTPTLAPNSCAPGDTTTIPANNSSSPITTTTAPPVNSTAPADTTTEPPMCSTGDPASSTTEAPASSTTGGVPVIASFMGYTPDLTDYAGGAKELTVEPGVNVVIKWSVSKDAKEVLVTPGMNAPSSDVEGSTSFTAQRDSDNPGEYTYTISAKNDAEYFRSIRSLKWVVA